MLMVAVAACSAPSTTHDAATTSLTSTTTTAPTTTAVVVSAQAADELCKQLAGSLPDWHIQTPSITHLSLNVMVQTWALAHGLNPGVIYDPKIVDRATTEHCAQTRTDALQALVLPDFATGLIGMK